MIKVAILGAGFCGLATAWTLLQEQPVEVTIFDCKDIGAGTSGIAAGLLHPFVGLHAKLNYLGIEGFRATEQLLSIAEKKLGRAVADRSGIIRLALTDAQKKNFKEASQLHSSHIRWIESDEMPFIPGQNLSPGIFIKTGITVYAGDYLEGLWLACKDRGANFVRQKISSLQELNHYDLIIAALGADCTFLPELSHLPLTRTKGQLLELKWPKDLPPLTAALNSQLYCIMSADRASCIVGSTYEKIFDSVEPNVTVAADEILPKLKELLPSLDGAEIIDCRSGIRATTPYRLPLITKVNAKCWAFSGMGSKGLLYHALYAKLLKEKIFG